MKAGGKNIMQINNEERRRLILEPFDWSIDD